MQFIKWLGSMIGALWNVLNFDIIGIGINLNMFLLGLSLFSIMISFFKRIGGIESGGVSALDRFEQVSIRKSSKKNR